MKSLIILTGYAVLVSAVTKERFYLPEEKQEIFRKVSNECAAKFSVDPELFPRTTDGTLPRDDDTNKYLHCLVQKTNLIDEDGLVLLDKFAGLLGNHPLSSKFKEDLKKCHILVKGDPVKTVVEFDRCYINATPVLIVV